MCHNPSWRKVSAESALMKIHFGQDPRDLTIEEMKKIEEEHGPDWYEKIGLDENPLRYGDSLKQELSHA